MPPEIIKSLDSKRVIFTSLAAAFVATCGLMMLGQASWMESKSKTVFQELESKVTWETGIILLCCALIVTTLLLGVALIVREIRVHCMLTRQLLRAYGHEPDV